MANTAERGQPGGLPVCRAQPKDGPAAATALPALRTAVGARSGPLSWRFARGRSRNATPSGRFGKAIEPRGVVDQDAPPRCFVGNPAQQKVGQFAVIRHR